MKFKILLLLLFLITITKSQTLCDSLVTMKKSIYGFHPTKLNDSLQILKSSEMDKFWAYAENYSDEAIPCIDKMIMDENEDGFFCYDASSLLLSLDKSKKYRQTVIAGLKKSNTEEIQMSDFLMKIIFFSKEGLDVDDLASKYIQTSKANAFLARHAMTLSRTLAAILIYGTIEDEHATKQLAMILNSSQTEYVKYTTAILLYIKNTEYGNSVLDSVKAVHALSDSTLSELDKYSSDFSQSYSSDNTYNRQQVLERLLWIPVNVQNNFFGFAGDKELFASACANLTHEDIPAIRDARKRAISGASDESLGEYLELTKLLFAVKNKK